MKRNLLISFLCLLCLWGSAAEKTDFEKAVRQAVERQMQTYPKSTLKDLYKNFFQDKFGPGHIVSDTTAAANYLRREMASYTDTKGEIAEPTGWEGNFYRVNLSVIKKGQIPYPVYFDAFIRSVNGIRPVPVAEWQKEWEQIEAVIRSMDLSLPGYEEDKKEIDDRLSRGEYVGHHSRIFEDSYSPHYRIISKDIFEEELQPLIQSSPIN
ncbi:hypothetical protein [Parabacteroides gordonii]|uniref:Uncharacterized protein n=1 Tax=Parabacteroides gordonii MS-1 = DSM 23371 TaxID=1203610 RepID=A0A0F5JSI0_9BACT|nr:hypothetical protein [Parabacteroides gordonii]KKB60352.1 hypothetical protein HMPREF1536_00232 [Parabacteroides gordonii MS-1 = DSM 23371]MCA5584307.1 hypothetical protein [Parabacteroides gordonii]